MANIGEMRFRKLLFISPQPTLWLKAIAIVVSVRPSVRKQLPCEHTQGYNYSPIAIIFGIQLAGIILGFWGRAPMAHSPIFLCAIIEGCAPCVYYIWIIYMYRVYAPNVTNFVSVCHFLVFNIYVFILRLAGILRWCERWGRERKWIQHFITNEQ